MRYAQNKTKRAKASVSPPFFLDVVAQNLSTMFWHLSVILQDPADVVHDLARLRCHRLFYILSVLGARYLPADIEGIARLAGRAEGQLLEGYRLLGPDYSGNQREQGYG